MSITAVSVRKSSTFQGVTNYWDNVYHFFNAANLDSTLATDLIDQVAAAEKLCHSGGITFEDGRAWEVGGTPAQNETLAIRDLSGTGAVANTVDMWHECCIVARCDTNRNTTTGKRIYLRKYYHTQHVPSALAGHLEGTLALGTTQKGLVKTCMESLREVTINPGSILMLLCAPGGQTVSDTRPVTVLDYLHSRQFRR